MMNFRIIKDAIINILGTAAAGRYQTIGFQRQTKAVQEAKNNNRMVTVYYSAGQFPENAGRRTGPVQHDITFRVEFTVAKAAEADLSTLNDPGSTANQRITALTAAQEAAQLADESTDELIEIIYQILMDARNYDMGLSVGIVANRWISSIQKNEPRTKGDLVELTAAMTLTLRTAEQVTGDTGTENGNIIDGTLDIKDNNPDIAGTLVDNT